MIRTIDTSQPCVCGGSGECKTDWSKGFDPKDCYIKCKRCGRETDRYTMPWLAWEAWDNHKYIDATQRNIFDFLGEQA